jgi:phage antirepressor YoqD-like protein
MADTETPGELSKELGVTARAIRQWLREQGWQSAPYSRWRLTPEQASSVRSHFRH